MNMESLWEKACGLLTRDMSYVSYTTWVEGNMEPVALTGDTLVLCVQMDSMRPMIVSKYGAVIDKCLTEVAGKPMQAKLTTRAEIAQQEAGGDVKDDNDPHLNPKYTFDNFIVGSSNRFAHAAALAVAETPGDAYNPLFLYGGVGLGKTHLMQAIGHFIHEEKPQLKIVYMTSETFTNQLIDAIQQKKTFEFREKIRMADVLMVDDIQFIAGRESTQQEFFNTFNELHNNGKQIIMTSDKPPKEIQRLEERLCSRFEWGLQADIQRPDIEMKVAILRNKCRQDGFLAPDDVLQLIAGKIETNIRELEGCLTRLEAYAHVSGDPVNTDLCMTALKDIFDQKRIRQITAELIMQTVSDYYGLTISDLTGPTRKREITVPRQIAMYLTREMTGMSLPQIGTVFGGRDHTTVLHSYKTVEAGMKTDSMLEAVVGEIQRLVKNAQ